RLPYSLSLHDALPISAIARGVGEKGCRTLRERRADRGVAPPSPGQTRRVQEPAGPRDRKPDPPQPGALAPQPPDKGRNPARTTPDRKSTRLNSSHGSI